jgi:hypothetical protein
VDVLDKSSWVLEATMVLSEEGVILWKTEDSKMYTMKDGRVMVFFEEDKVFRLKMSISTVRLTRNVSGNWRGMWKDESNKWWERFLRMDLMRIVPWNSKRLVFYYVNKMEEEELEF